MRTTIISSKIIRSFVFYFILILSTNNLISQHYIPSVQNLEARKQFQDDKFGMFIHWGVYSILGDGEWVMNNQGIPINIYEKLPAMFNPIDFNAQEWVSFAKSAGMNYITITSKHHDGFAMFDSKVSDYNIVDATPYGKDVIKELADECAKQGLRFYVYYSQLDWHHPDYFPRGRTGLKSGRPESGNWDNYLKYQNAQIKELAENYKINGFWFDGWWDQENQPKGVTDWNLEETYKIIHGVNSALLVGNNHHVAPFEGEDFQMFEKDLPGSNTTGFATSAEDIGNLPMETCETINHSWGFNLQDSKHKSVKTLVQYVVRAAGYGANFLLNVGPMPNGKIQNEHIQNLKEVGNWLKENGFTIYGTSKGPIPPSEWGVSVQKENQIYIHILDPKENTVFINNFKLKIKSLKYLNSNKLVDFETLKNAIVIHLEEDQIVDMDTILELIIE